MNRESKLFMKDGKYCIIERNIGESMELFIERGWFIVDNLFSKSLDELILESNIWSHEIYQGCKYD